MYVGIDQALGHTGFAVLRPDGQLEKLSVVATGSLTGAPRLARIRDGLRDLLSNYGVKQAAMEGYSYDSVGRTFDLGEVGGIVRLLLYDLGVQFVVVAPAQLKKFAGTSPQATKEMVAKAVKKKWSIAIDQDDACDAFVLAQVAKVYATRKSTYRDELEVLKALTKKADPFESVAKSRTKISL